MTKFRILLKLALAIWVSMSMFACAHSGHANSHKNHREEHAKFDLEDLKLTIAELGKLWDKGLKTEDIDIFLNLYDKNAHYLPNDAAAIHGNRAIAENWQGAFGSVIGLTLDLETLEGNRKILYETGHGTVEIKNDTGGSDQFKFKYVNVWKLQKDGSYKVVIDTFNAPSGQ